MSIWKTGVRHTRISPDPWGEDVELDAQPNNGNKLNNEETKVKNKRPPPRNVVVPVDKDPETEPKQEETFVYVRSKKKTEDAALDEYLNRNFNSAGHAWTPYLAERRAHPETGTTKTDKGVEHTKKNSCKTSCWREFLYSFEIWGSSLKSIEGRQGTSCVSFFVFLRWLFFLNIFIFLLLFWAVAFFQIAFAKKTSYDKDLTGDMYSTATADTCSTNYQPVVSSKAASRILDFIQGTGWMEDTTMFYGHYSSKKVSLSAFGYNLPLAYFLTVLIVMLSSLVFMVYKTLSSFKEAVMSHENSKHVSYCNMVFSGMEFSISDEHTLQVKQTSIFRGLVSDLEEQRFQRTAAERDCVQKCGLYTVRFLINFIIFLMLGGGGAAIYYAQDYSASFTTKTDVSLKYSKVIILLVQFLPSIVISLLNGIFPAIFGILVNFERVRPATVIKLTLIRTVFLRLASLAMIMASLYVQITCSDKDSCDTGQNNCAAIKCWESYVGAAIYKLMVTDLVICVVMTLLVELPRKLIATHCECILAKKIGPAEFDIPKNVLDLVYGQTLCWLGLYYSPLIPAVSVFRFFTIFYVKKLSAMYNTIPPQKPYLASKSNTFFTVILLLAFFMVCVPLGYTLARMDPSKTCGPFRIYGQPSDIIYVQINNASHWFQNVWGVLTSAAVVASMMILLLLAVYYCSALNSARKGLIELMKQQLIVEGKDKQFLLTRISGQSGGQPPPYHSNKIKAFNEVQQIKYGSLYSSNTQNGSGIGIQNSNAPPQAQYHNIHPNGTSVLPKSSINKSTALYQTGTETGVRQAGRTPAVLDNW